MALREYDFEDYDDVNLPSVEQMTGRNIIPLPPVETSREIKIDQQANPIVGITKSKDMFGTTWDQHAYDLSKMSPKQIEQERIRLGLEVIKNDNTSVQKPSSSNIIGDRGFFHVTTGPDTLNKQRALKVEQDLRNLTPEQLLIEEQNLKRFDGTSAYKAPKSLEQIKREEAALQKAQQNNKNLFSMSEQPIHNKEIIINKSQERGIEKLLSKIGKFFNRKK